MGTLLVFSSDSAKEVAEKEAAPRRGGNQEALNPSGQELVLRIPPFIAPRIGER